MPKAIGILILFLVMFPALAYFKPVGQAIFCLLCLIGIAYINKKQEG